MICVFLIFKQCVTPTAYVLRVLRGSCSYVAELDITVEHENNQRSYINLMLARFLVALSFTRFLRLSFY